MVPATPSSSHPPAESQTFHLFPRLPPELRLKIWQEALPPNLGPLVLPYRKSFWRNVKLGRSNWITEPDSAKLHVSFSNPLTRVNRESKAVALQWIAEQQSVTVSRSPAPLNFERTFDRHRDVVYLLRQPWSDFMRDARSKLEAKVRGVHGVAVHEGAFFAMGYRNLPFDTLCGQFVTQGIAEVLYILCSERKFTPQGREWWEIGPPFGGTFVWSNKDLTFNFLDDGSGDLNTRMCVGKTTSGEDAYDTLTRLERIHWAIKRLGLSLRQMAGAAREIEVRPVSVVVRTV